MDALHQTLDAVARITAGLEDPWWLIGSAAAAVIGADAAVRDVDLLCSDRDALALLALPGGLRKPTGGGLFRSRVYGLVGAGPLETEVMAGLEVLSAGIWTPVAPRTRLCIGGVFVADAAEQAMICRLFGRPKDLVRAEVLDALT